MPHTLTDDDYAALSHLQHERLRSHFPAELQDAALLTRADASLVIACDWEAIALLNEDWDSFAHFVYVCTGCSSTSFYVDGAVVLTQTRAIQLQQSVNNEARAMVAVAERTTAAQAAAMKTMTEAAEAVVAAKPPRTIAEIVRELADAIAAEAIARVESSAVIVNGRIAATTPEQAVSAPEPDTLPPTPDTPHPTPSKLPTVRLKGRFIPGNSTWVQSAKRYLKAVDPTGEATTALQAIVMQTPTGKAHIERALREYPQAEREAGAAKLYKAFLKIADARGMSTTGEA